MVKIFTKIISYIFLFVKNSVSLPILSAQVFFVYEEFVYEEFALRE